MRSGISALRRIALSAGATALVMWGLLYAPTPYAVYEPGIAVPVEPMIEYASGSRGGQGEGELLLTAVKLTLPNMWGVLKAAVDGDRDIYLKNDVFGQYSQQQYSERLTVIMEGSQQDALEAAYRYLNVPYRVETASIVVTDVILIADHPAGKLKAGDRLIGIQDGERFQSVEHAAKLVAAVLGDVRSGQGQSVILEADRGGETLEIELRDAEAMAGDTGGEAKRLAELLGVKGFTELRAVQAEQEEQSLRISAREIGGPSAGLVFALAAIDLLTEGDLTGGGRIAATGTIDPSGRIGAIGGIKQKVVSTDAEGASLFLVPKANEGAAAAKARSMGSDMQIVGVETLQEAMNAVASFTKRL
ncbi:S16 family serine protease [Paenibacillus sp. PL2-23]|uniref:S16 family serine protease n=1 Tax=Paenibacillus sp. PL2-23 TaxID=2100729 RepID=UPI0030F56BDF